MGKWRRVPEDIHIEVALWRFWLKTRMDDKKYTTAYRGSSSAGVHPSDPPTEDDKARGKQY